MDEYMDLIQEGKVEQVHALRQLDDEFAAVFASTERILDVYDHFKLNEMAYEIAGIRETLTQVQRMHNRARAKAKTEYGKNIKVSA